MCLTIELFGPANRGPTRSSGDSAFILLGMGLLALWVFVLFCITCEGQSAGNAAAVFGQLGSFTSRIMNCPTGNVASSTATGLGNFLPCVTVDADGSVYVCDRDNNRVVRFIDFNSSNAVWGQPTLTTPGFGLALSPPTASSLSGPRDVGFYGGDMFVADGG